MKIQVYLSTKCSANCRFCLTQQLRKNFEFEENIDMRMEIVNKVLDYDLDEFFICSNRGEALLNRNIDYILIKAKRKEHKINFSTNAFYKNSDWWKNLGKIFDDGDYLSFPLDGIGNKTHRLHRKTDFYIVLKNIESFINAGGNAIWKFILFEHNQHQVELSSNLAKEIGCVAFQTLNSHTYDSVLKEPTNKVWTSDNIMDQDACKNDYLPCEDEMYYINVKGIVFPCCFLANIFGNKPLRDNHKEKRLVEIFNKEKAFLNIWNTDIQDIINNSLFFRESITKSYLCKEICLRWTRNQC